MSQRNLRAMKAIGDEMEGVTLEAKQLARFVETLKRKTEKEKRVFSTNGALEYATTGSSLVDFDSRTTEFRNTIESAIMKAAASAYEENPVQFVKLMFQNGDIRGGKGERYLFNTCMDWLIIEHPAIADEVLAYIPEYTRWDYLVRLVISDNKKISNHATELVVSQLMKDKEAVEQAGDGGGVNISLLAKWLPSLQTKKADQKKCVRHLLKSLHMQERDYRHLLSELRGHLNVIEKAMSAKDYNSIDMEKMTAKQQLRYAGYLNRVMAEKRHAYIQAVLRGEKKMNASVLNPLEIWHEYLRKSSNSWYVTYDEDYEALWLLLHANTSGDENILVIRDGSGSMCSPIGSGSSATMLEAASAMSVYCAEHLDGAFKNKFITFSRRPQLVDMSGCTTLAEKMNLLEKYDDCSNTNLEATFDLVLYAAIENQLSQKELPKYLLILSDMEFDEARGSYRGWNWNSGDWEVNSRDTLFDTIRKKWDIAGYEMPTLVFWQLNGARTIYPEIDAKNGIIFLSGFSTSELQQVMAGEFERMEEVAEEIEVIDDETNEKHIQVVTRQERVVLSPLEQLEFKLLNERYDAIEEAAKRGLEKESKQAEEI